MISDKTLKLLAISKLPKVGKSAINQLAKKPIDWDKDINDIVKKFLPNHSLQEITKEVLDWCNSLKNTANQLGDIVISQLDDSYPQNLIDTLDAPAFLFCRGNISLLKTPCLAIIGTRAPTDDGKIIGRNITKWFSEKGWTIVSGLALGIDTIAHEVCLEGDGKTIVVLGSNLNKVYPAENKNLLNNILLSNGLVISEYPYDNKGFKSQFVERDRIQAGLSNAVIMIQSGLDGGSMHASKAILKYKRFLIIVNQSKSDILKNDPKIEANMALIKADIEKVKDIMEINDLRVEQIIKMMNKREYEVVNNKIFNLNAIKLIDTNESFDF